MYRFASVLSYTAKSPPAMHSPLFKTAICVIGMTRVSIDFSGPILFTQVPRQEWTQRTGFEVELQVQALGPLRDVCSKHPSHPFGSDLQAYSLSEKYPALVSDEPNVSGGLFSQNRIKFRCCKMNTHFGSRVCHLFLFAAQFPWQPLRRSCHNSHFNSHS